MTTPFYIQVGMSSNGYNQLNHLYNKKNVDKQPAGLNFYEQNWNRLNSGTVQLMNGEYSFNIPHVLSSTGIEDLMYPDRGMYKFSVQSGINPDEFIQHDQARLQLMKTLQELVSLGWQSYIEYQSDPRLLGQESFQFALDDGIYAPDPMYTPTLDEWMALKSSHSWVFHVNNVFMELGFRRNNKHMERNGKGVYLLTYRFLIREAHARNHFQGEEREQWESLWVESIKKDKVMRYEKEVELIKQGYRINTDYVDPKIHPEDPVEPEGVDELLDYIQKHNP